MLGSELPEVRQSALSGLVEYPEAAAVLCRQFESEQDAATRDMIAVVLSRMGGAQTVEGLLPLLRSDNATLRNSVIGILKELPAEVAPHMEALLDNPDSDVRILVVNVLESLRHPKVEDWLIAVISVDAHVNVVATALDLLREVGTDAALPALGGVTTRFPDEPFIAFAVNNALKQIQSAG
ncbi:HEAT repeat domain-containing protein [Neorhizobium lilium]|uniref:HEAT repeat domain-containing protein n=2 Tax=Neorhizobium lilium TaxID=2503024 RepID=A0A3S3U4N0_9HYPH|nr:HEAT repeat domain-containing protein [Neorhizobium lilium]